MLPFFLGDQAALTYRTQIKSKVKTLDQAFDTLRQTFLTEEARRANDSLWDNLTFENVTKILRTESKREILRYLFTEIERLRFCTSSAAAASNETMSQITRAKLLSSVNGIRCFAYVRANPPAEYLRLRSALYDAATQEDTEALRKGNGRAARSAGLSDVLYTDRKFRQKRHGSSAVSPYEHREGRREEKGTGPRYAGKDKKCWVCGKDGCHSSKHQKHERQRWRDRLQSMLTEALDSDDESEMKDSEDGHEDNEFEYADGGCFSTVLQSTTFLLARGANPACAHDFLGIALDTACTHLCTVSREQYLAYCRYTGQKSKIDHKQRGLFNTSAGRVESIGTAAVSIPFKPLVEVLVLHVHVFDFPSTAPFLLCYAEMKKQGWDILIGKKRLVSSDDHEKFVKFEEIDGLPVYRWHPSQNVELRTETNVSLFTYQELRNIHRRMGHPTAKRLMELLKKHPDADSLGPNTRAMLQRIVNSCKACQLLAKAPQRFRFTLHDESRFNHVVLVDIFKLSDGNVLHVICEGTKYQLGVFVNPLTSESCWDALRMCWMNVLNGSPDIIRADAGRQFDSKLFKDRARAEGVVVKIVPTEAHHKIGKVERYHEVVRRVYEKLKHDDPTMSPELRLSTTFRCINDSAGTDGIVPTLLVFGTNPKLGVKIDHMAPTTIQRANAIREATQLA